MDVKEAKALALSDEKVTLKPIVRNKPFFKPGHDGEFMFSGCGKGYQLPFVMSTRSYAKIFESSDEQEAFEVLLNRPKGSLNIYDRDNEFWAKYSIEITKEGKELDLSIASHALEYRVLKANSSRIAPDWESRNRPGYEFALINESQVQEESYRASDRQEEAMTLFLKVSKSAPKMYNLLRIMGRSYDKNAKDNVKFLKGELLKIMEQKEKIRGTNMANIDDFIKAAKDPDYDTKVMIYDAIDKGEIIMKGNTLKINVTNDVIGSNIEQAVSWINSLQNQETKLLLKQRLQ